MPNKRKGRKATAATLAADDDDNVSISSDQTVSTQHMSDDDGLTEEEKYEEKVREAMDLAAEKSVHTRTNALISLKTAFQKKLMISFLMDNYQTITDMIEKSLKKGKGLEQVAAAKLASVLIVTLFGHDEGENIYNELQNLLAVIVQDPAASPVVRQEVAHTLALSAFLACPERSDLPTTLNNLHKVFCAALPKGNGELPTHTGPVMALHSAALQGVCLLITLLSNQAVHNMAPKFLSEVVPVLGSSDVDLRIMVGEAIALMYESAREYNEDFRMQRDKEMELRNTLTELATDSHKYRGKKERKLQRASFREVLKCVESDESICETVSIGPSNYRQELVLDSWRLRFQYQAMCHALDVGLNNHMTFNPALRNVFDLGPPPVIIAGNLSVYKSQKKPNHESPAVKARSLARSKNRDNRAADLCYDD